MIRTLVLIAGASFVLCVACLVGAAALGWHDLHHWRNIRLIEQRHAGWVRGDDDATNSAGVPFGGGPPTSRDIAWSGGDALDIDVPGDVQFTQAPGPGKITVTGPADEISHVVVSGSHLRLDDDVDFSSPLKIVMTAPDVSHFSISGADTLEISNFSQDELDLDVSGAGAVTAKGKAHSTRIDISGDSQVDFSGLAVDAAEASISGAGRAAIAPVTSADLHISGEGEIDLLTHPPQLNSDVSGEGRILEGQPAPKPS